MTIHRISDDKKQFLPLLLLADEQESMIDAYLERGTLFLLWDGGVKAVCVVTDEGGGVCELKNLATDPRFQRQGYGTALVCHICDCYRPAFHTMLVGTGDSALTLPFYQRCGFIPSHRVKDFFLQHYDHPIVECGKQLTDMIYLKKQLSTSANGT